MENGLMTDCNKITFYVNTRDMSHLPIEHNLIGILTIAQLSSAGHIEDTNINVFQTKRYITSQKFTNSMKRTRH